MKYELSINNIEELGVFASNLYPSLFRGAIICLGGDLGAGKTTFTKMLAKAMGIEATVNSPTFNILKIYENEVPLYHMDVYRLEGIGYDYELDDFLYGDGISVVEWYKFIEVMLPKDVLEITIIPTGGTTRKIILKGTGRYEDIVQNISNRYSN